MSITVKYFASLREQAGRGEANLPAEGIATAADAWRAASGDLPMPANLLVAINQDYADLEASVRDGDEVAFFPPVTGG